MNGVNEQQKMDDVFFNIITKLLEPRRAEIRKKYKWRLRWALVKIKSQIFYERLQNTYSRIVQQI